MIKIIIIKQYKICHCLTVIMLRSEGNLKILITYIGDEKVNNEDIKKIKYYEDLVKIFQDDDMFINQSYVDNLGKLVIPCYDYTYASYEDYLPNFVENFDLTIHVNHDFEFLDLEDYYLGRYASSLSINKALVSALNPENLAFYKKWRDETIRGLLKKQHLQMLGVSFTKSALNNF